MEKRHLKNIPNVFVLLKVNGTYVYNINKTTGKIRVRFAVSKV
jgi:hypothetical protein